MNEWMNKWKQNWFKRNWHPRSGMQNELIMMIYLFSFWEGADIFSFGGSTQYICSCEWWVGATWTRICVWGENLKFSCISPARRMSPKQIAKLLWHFFKGGEFTVLEPELEPNTKDMYKQICSVRVNKVRLKLDRS